MKLISWLESRNTYLYLHLFTVVPIVFLSFDKNVHYYKNWRFLFPAIALVAMVFIGWDVFFTVKGIWGFNDQYVLGLFLSELPLEEWMFFITVPFACVFIYECLNFYVKKDWLLRFDQPISIFLSALFLVIGFLNWPRMYTATTFILAGAFLLWHFLTVPNSYRTRFYLAYAVSWIPFLLVNGVLTGAYTEYPVVIYNPEEYLGIRITAVPIEDSVFGFILFLGVVTLYERFRRRR
ncbi:MAG: lycopene cyclase domain-containing protein [Saprospiraceae bacterium]|nr:lycopene cyclase domain-containing protein [Saprospiraceae bacterium]